MEKKTERISAVITKQHKEELEKIAQREERTISWIIAKAIEEYIKNNL